MDAYALSLLNGLVTTSLALDGILIFLAQDLPYVLIALFMAYVFFCFKGRGRLTPTIIALAAIGIARGAAELIRFFYHRPRPFIAAPIAHLLTNDSWSFPSGHASAFFALSAVAYGFDKRLGIAFFTASLVMGLARVAVGVHYLSDIIGGAVLGAVVGYALWNLYLRTKNLPASSVGP
jgi:undecaprenyl-diphosphatase